MLAYSGNSATAAPAKPSRPSCSSSAAVRLAPILVQLQASLLTISAWTGRAADQECLHLWRESETNPAAPRS